MLNGLSQTITESWPAILAAKCSISIEQQAPLMETENARDVEKARQELGSPRGRKVAELVMTLPFTRRSRLPELAT